MFKIGCHLSVAKGYASMAKDAVNIGTNVIQFFIRNPRGGCAKYIDINDVEEFKSICIEHGFGPFLVHAPYTLNLCSNKEKTKEFSFQVIKEDLSKIDEYFGGGLYNLHPGSHVGQGMVTGINLIIDALNKSVPEGCKSTLLLETMAGKGSEVGGNFEEIKKIIDGVDSRINTGVCMDTCHIYDAGYDIVNNLECVLKKFDSVIGIDKLKAVHLNDSMNQLGSHKDRHQKIGKGYIGIETFRQIINHPLLKDIPFYLETPNELEGYAQEISILKNMIS